MVPSLNKLTYIPMFKQPMNIIYQTQSRNQSSSKYRVATTHLLPKTLYLATCLRLVKPRGSPQFRTLVEVRKTYWGAWLDVLAPGVVLILFLGAMGGRWMGEGSLESEL